MQAGGRNIYPPDTGISCPLVQAVAVHAAQAEFHGSDAVFQVSATILLRGRNRGRQCAAETVAVNPRQKPQPSMRGRNRDRTLGETSPGSFPGPRNGAGRSSSSKDVCREPVRGVCQLVNAGLRRGADAIRARVIGALFPCVAQFAGPAGRTLRGPCPVASASAGRRSEPARGRLPGGGPRLAGAVSAILLERREAASRLRLSLRPAPANPQGVDAAAGRLAGVPSPERRVSPMCQRTAAPPAGTLARDAGDLVREPAAGLAGAALPDRGVPPAYRIKALT
jgi:hypothetical protein